MRTTEGYNIQCKILNNLSFQSESSPRIMIRNIEKYFLEVTIVGSAMQDRLCNNAKERPIVNGFVCLVLFGNDPT